MPDRQQNRSERRYLASMSKKGLCIEQPDAPPKRTLLQNIGDRTMMTIRRFRREATMREIVGIAFLAGLTIQQLVNFFILVVALIVGRFR